MEKCPVLAIVVPCYNEEEIIKLTINELSNLLDNLIQSGQVAENSYISFVDDGSRDSTWDILSKEAELHNKVRALRFACNFGHQKAIYAGMCENKADIYITLDCDLQDDISIISEMINKYKKGNLDVVYAVRNDRNNDTYIKRSFAELFYKLSTELGLKSIYNSADFRLVTDKVVTVLRHTKESNLYLRGLIFNYNFKYDIVHFSRKNRIGGEPKYNFTSSFRLAMNGITSLTVKPIRLIGLFAFMMFLLSILFLSKTYFAGSIILLSIYILGEYLFAALIESKKRPDYVIYDKIN